MSGTASGVEDSEHDMAIRQPFRTAPTAAEMTGIVAIIAIGVSIVLWMGWVALSLFSGRVGL